MSHNTNTTQTINVTVNINTALSIPKLKNIKMTQQQSSSSTLGYVQILLKETAVHRSHRCWPEVCVCFSVSCYDMFQCVMLLYVSVCHVMVCFSVSCNGMFYCHVTVCFSVMSQYVLVCHVTVATTVGQGQLTQITIPIYQASKPTASFVDFYLVRNFVIFRKLGETTEHKLISII